MPTIPELQGTRPIPGGQLLWNYDEGFLSIPAWPEDLIPLPGQMGFDPEEPEKARFDTQMGPGLLYILCRPDAELPHFVNLMELTREGVGVFSYNTGGGKPAASADVVAAHRNLPHPRNKKEEPTYERTTILSE